MDVNISNKDRTILKNLLIKILQHLIDINKKDSSSNGQNSVQKIKTYEILNSLKNVSESGSLKKVLSKAHKRNKVLDTPLPKYLSEKAQRISSYIEEKKEVSKWDYVVQKNRRVATFILNPIDLTYNFQENC